MSTATRPPRPLPALAISAGAALLVYLAARAVIVHVPVYDELLHYLAAQGFNATGRPVIAAGEYTRAELFTVLVARSLAWFGPSLVAARLPSLLAVMLLGALLAGWLARRVGAAAAAAAVVALCLVPTTVELADFVRFYALHALLITLMGIATYEAAAPARAGAARAAWGVLALLCLPLAWHLQSTTLVAALAVVTALLSLLVRRHWPTVARFCRVRPVPLLLAAAAATGVAVWLTLRLNLLAPLREVPLWAAWAANDPLYYAKAFADAVPLLWPLLPLAAVVALRTHGELAQFALVALLVALLVHSIAAAKSLRYLYYAVPWCCVLWACAIDGALRWWRARRPAASALGLSLPPLLIAMGLTLSSEGQRLARLLVGRAQPAEVLSYASEPDWTPLVKPLRPWMSNNEQIVTSNSMKAIYFLGRYDYELNASIVLETDTGQEFGRDERTGGRAISTAASVDRVIGGPRGTLVILEDRKLDSPVGVPGSALDRIRAVCTKLALPGGTAVSAWHCPR